MLFWLDPDREQAGRKYETIRTRLIKIFTCRGCHEAEDLADETINRVILKAEQLAPSYVGDPALYFYGVANNVHHEYLRRKTPQAPPLSHEPSEELERSFECLEKCMRNLSPENRELILEYYREERRAKIDRRKRLADKMGIALNALRLRAHRIRESLYVCVQNCLGRNAAS